MKYAKRLHRLVVLDDRQLRTIAKADQERAEHRLVQQMGTIEGTRPSGRFRFAPPLERLTTPWRQSRRRST